MRALVNVAIALLFTLPAIAAPIVRATTPNGLPSDGSDAIRYLVPITAHEVPGAHGSLWSSELTVLNPFSETLQLRGRFCEENELSLCVATVDAPFDVSTNVSLFPSTGNEGAFLYAPRFASFEFAKQLRVRDVAHDEDNFGSEVPVVDVETDFAFTQRLLDVPTDPRYRALLRIYGPDDAAIRVAVNVYSPAGGEAIEQREFVLNGKATATEFPFSPSYLAVDPITDVVRASGHARVRVDVLVVAFPDPPPPSTLWAFISITNNTTNQFTVITPQK